MKTVNASATLLVICTGLLVLHLVCAWPWAVYAALVIGLLGILSHSFSNAVATVWMKVAHGMSLISSSIVLGMVFYLVLLPVALVARMFTKDPLMLSRNYATYFVKIDKTIDKKDLEKPW